MVVLRFLRGVGRGKGCVGETRGPGGGMMKRMKCNTSIIILDCNGFSLAIASSLLFFYFCVRGSMRDEMHVGFLTSFSLVSPSHFCDF